MGEGRRLSFKLETLADNCGTLFPYRALSVETTGEHEEKMKIWFVGILVVVLTETTVSSRYCSEQKLGG